MSASQFDLFVFTVAATVCADLGYGYTHIQASFSPALRSGKSLTKKQRESIFLVKLLPQAKSLAKSLKLNPLQVDGTEIKPLPSIPLRLRQIETARLYFRRARPEGEVAEPTAAQQASLARPLRELTEQTRRAALGVAGHRDNAPPAASPAPARAHVETVPPASPGVGRLLLDDGGAAFEAAAVAAADAAEAAVAACGFHTPRRLAVHGGGEDDEASFDQAAVAATLAAEQRASARGAAVARLEAFRFLDDPRPSSRM